MKRDRISKNPRTGRRTLAGFRAIAAAGMWPPPVYVAKFWDGTERRMTFWTEAGKLVDEARGKKLALGIEPGKEFKVGWVEFDNTAALDRERALGEAA